MREKLLVGVSMLVMLVILCGLTYLSSRAEFTGDELRSVWPTLVLLPWCALGVGVFLTLSLGHPAGACWLTLLLPAGVATALITLWPRLPLGSPEPPGWIWVTVFAAYGAVGLLLAWQRLRRWQDTGVGALEISFVWRRRAKEVERAACPAKPRRALRALIFKELNLQQMNLAMFAVLVVLFFGGVLLAKHTSTDLEDLPARVARVLWFILPFTIGAIAVAEERRSNVVEWQHCLPVARGRQWWIKTAFCFALSLFISSVAGVVDYLVTSDLVKEDWSWRWLLVLLAWHVAGTTIGLYASSLTRNFIQAVSLSFGAVALLGACTAMTVWLVGYQRYWDVPPQRLLMLIGGLVFAPLLLILGRRNYPHLQITLRTAFTNACAWILALIACIALTAAIYLRSWELITLREPPAGPSMAKRGTIPTVGGWHGRGTLKAVLAPDGRIRELRSMRFFQDDAGRWARRPEVDSEWAVGGSVFSDANWKQIAEAGGYLFALNRDGTLWRVRFSEFSSTDYDPEPIVSERLWRAIPTDGWGWGGLAIDENRGLWHWGRENLPAESMAAQMVEVSPGAQWKDAVQLGRAGFGIQIDGSLWSWGEGYVEGTGWLMSPAPTRMGRETDWESFGVGWSGSGPIVRKIDGSYWMERGHARGFVSLAQDGISQRWIRIGQRTDWKQLVHSYPYVDAIREDGSRWRGELVRYDRKMNTLILRERRVGRRNDWVAIDRGFGLTADGKIWNWDTARSGYYDGGASLIPPRFRSKVIADLAVPGR